MFRKYFYVETNVVETEDGKAWDQETWESDDLANVILWEGLRGWVGREVDSGFSIEMTMQEHEAAKKDGFTV